MSLTPREIDKLADDALDQACLHIQSALNIDSGDIAGVVFSGHYGDAIKQALVNYIRMEIAFKEKR